MDELESLSHTKWECKYHVVFIPKCRRRTLYEELRRHLGEVFRKLAVQKESRIEEGHLMPDHVHMMIAIPPKYAVSQVVGYIKGKSAIHLARVYGERRRNFVGQQFWARGSDDLISGILRRPQFQDQPEVGARKLGFRRIQLIAQFPNRFVRAPVCHVMKAHRQGAGLGVGQEVGLGLVQGP